MKEKISNGYKKYKELKKVPRYNALIKLGLYLVFFLVFGSIFMLNRVPNNNETKETTNITNTNKYSFIYMINDIIINGNKDENIVFNYNDVEYKIIDNELSCNIENCEFEYMYLFELFNPISINNYIKKGEVLYKTEYNDGTIEYKYKIIDEKVNKYFNSDSSFEIIKKDNKYIINLENYNIFDKITIEYK